MTESCVIVGGGLAGATAAFTLRSGGFEGRVVLVCEEGRQPYSKPELSKGILRGDVPDLRTRLRPEDWYDKQRIELVLGDAAQFLDLGSRQVRLRSGECVPFGSLLLTTGGRPRQLPGLDGLPNVVTLRTLEDAHALRDRLGPGRSLLVVGGGFIGAEVAASARSTGSEVTILEAEPAPLSRLLPPLVSDVYARLHRSRGVDIRVNSGVAQIESDGDAVCAVDTAGRRHRADTIVVSIGIVPNTELAEEAGLLVDNGIVVDEYCRTSAPGVYAAGDVANHPNHFLGGRVRIEHWQNAQHHGAAAARAILGQADPFAEVPWVWSDQYEVNLQIAGAPRPDDDVVVRGDVEALDFTAFLIRRDRLVAAIGVNRPDDVRFGRKLIGAGWVADRALLADASRDLEELAAVAA